MAIRQAISAAGLTHAGRSTRGLERGTGLRQLEASTEALFASKRYQYILQRLVYVAEERVTVLDSLPDLEPDDEYAEVGVVWVPPAAVEEAARELEITLPENWLEPESREGAYDDPEREAWREFADTEVRRPDATDSANPMADALRRRRLRRRLVPAT